MNKYPDKLWRWVDAAAAAVAFGVWAAIIFGVYKLGIILFCVGRG